MPKSTPATLPDMPNPGANRFWWGIHNPSSVKTPMILELRESTLSPDREIKHGFSRLIAKQPVIADAAAIAEAADQILTRASRVDEFVGIIGEKGQ